MSDVQADIDATESLVELDQYEIVIDNEQSGDPSLWISQVARTDDTGAPDNTTLFVASTDDEDRALDVVRQDWRLGPFRRNPIILDNHRRLLPVGRSIMEKVPINGEDAGRLMIRVEWNMSSPRPEVRAVGQEHLNGFRTSGSVGFRHGKRTRRDKLPEGHRYHRKPKKIKTPWGEYEMAGWLFEQNTLLEFSSASIPMNIAATQRAAVGHMSESERHKLERLAELDPGDIDGRVRVVGQAQDRATGGELVANVRELLADPESRELMAQLLFPDVLGQMRSSEQFRALVLAVPDLTAAPRPPSPPPTQPKSWGDDLDWMFPELQAQK